MELWKSILLTLHDESVYAPLLVIMGASMVVLKQYDDEKEYRLLFLAFVMGSVISITLTPFIFEWLEGYHKKLATLRPLGYFTIAYYGDAIFEALRLFIAFIMSKQIRSKIFNSMLDWILESLTKLKQRDS